MSHDSKTDIAAAIDEAARGLSAIEPRGYMASRVLAHLGPQRPRQWRTTVVLAVAGAAAMTVAVLLTNTSVTPPPAVPATASTPAPSAPSVDPVRSPMVATPRHDLARNTAVKSRPAARPDNVPEESAAAAAWRSRAVRALPEPDPIEGQVSQPEPIDLPLLQLKALETPPIQLSRLDGGQR